MIRVAGRCRIRAWIFSTSATEEQTVELDGAFALDGLNLDDDSLPLKAGEGIVGKFLYRLGDKSAIPDFR